MLINLDNAILNKKYIIDKIDLDNTIKIKLLNLGLTKNTTIIPLFKSAFNDPVSYLIKGSVIALRKCDTKNIYVKECVN